jgi:hypothetical protein
MHAVRVASGLWPAGQRVQAIPSAVTWPAGQARHDPPPAAGIWPTGQVWHAVEPRGAIWPAGQTEQAVEPSVEENRPDGQNWQTGEPAPWNMPAGQMAQDTPSATGVEPGGQARHIRSFAATMPRGQAEQAALRAPGATRPAAHGRHSVERWGANWPGPHGSQAIPSPTLRVPPGQAAQRDGVWAISPAAQARQAEAPGVVETRPGPQVWQVAVPPGEAVPAGHAAHTPGRAGSVWLPAGQGMQAAAPAAGV